MSSTLASFCTQQKHTPPSSSSSSTLTPLLSARCRYSSSSLFFPRQRLPGAGSKARIVLYIAASASPFDELHEKGSRNRSKNSVLLNLVQEIEPLDVSLIQKDVPTDTIDAMKRTISSMLGLLPSDQFHVLVESFWESLSKLLISSIMTGYTLRNAEYRLSLERNLANYNESSKKERTHAEDSKHQQPRYSTSKMSTPSHGSDLLPQETDVEESSKNMGSQNLEEMNSNVKEYMKFLQSRLSSMEKELCDIKRRNSALEMHRCVGEENNDVLDYLRSLQPEKVVELSEPACPEVKEAVHTVVHGLLATLSPRIHSEAPQSENTASGTLNDGKDDSAEVMENTSIHFQPLISLSRDYLARLLFWCMLLGHYLRGLEYRLELMQLLTLPGNAKYVPPGSDQVA